MTYTITATTASTAATASTTSNHTHTTSWGGGHSHAMNDPWISDSSGNLYGGHSHIGSPPNTFLPNPNTGTNPYYPPYTNTPWTPPKDTDTTPITIEREVLVRKCPQCEAVKRVESDWDDDDYVCKECRG